MTTTSLTGGAIKAGSGIEASQPGHIEAREAMARFQEKLEENFWARQQELRHTIRRYLPAEELVRVEGELDQHGAALAAVQPEVTANDARMNYPTLEPYDGIGRRTDEIRHHGGYSVVGDALYGNDVVRRLVKRGGLREGLAFYFLNCMLGEAGHNCPVICNFETARLLQGLPD